MPEYVDEQRVQLAVQGGFRRHRRFQRARAMYLKQYVGHYYREDRGVEGDEPINLIFHVIRALVPNLVMRNPVNMVTTEITDYKMYAYMLGLALDDLNDRMDLKTVVRRAIVDALFAMGIVKVGLDASDQMYVFGDIRVDPGQVYVDNVDFDDFVADPSCMSWEEAAFLGHRSRVPRQLLLDDDFTDHDLVMRLPRSSHPDASKKARALTDKGMSSQQMAELQDYVDIVELYIPDANAIIMTPDPDQMIADRYIKMQDFYGPKKGPYRFLTLTQPVPGNPFPVAPVGIWYDLHITANRLMRKQMERAENQKSVIVVDPGAADQGEDLRDADDGEILVGNPDSVTTVSTLGAEEGTHSFLTGLQVWFNYMSGNPDQLAGLQSQAETATQATILQGNANVTIEDSRGMIYDFTAGINEDMAFYLHYDPFIDIPLTVRRREWFENQELRQGMQMQLTPKQRRGEHLHYTFKIKPRSMSALDPLVLSQRIIDFATKVVPALVAAAFQCSQMGIPFNLQRSITMLADQLELSDYVQDWFNDPEFMRRIQFMLAMGPGPEGKAQPVTGVLQNGGSPNQQAGRPKDQLQQQAQELAGVMQSAIQAPGRGGSY